MKELEKNELMGVDGGFIIKFIGLDGTTGHQNMYFLDTENGNVYDITGQLVYHYMGDW